MGFRFTSTHPTLASCPKLADFVADFNNNEISDSQFREKLQKVGITKKPANAIVEERKKRTLLPLDFKIVGVAKTTIDKICDNWY